MRFAHVEWLYALWGIIPLILLFLGKEQRREVLLKRFAEGHLLEDLAGRPEQGRRWLKDALILLVYIFTVVAFARPQWGFQWQEFKRQGLDILVAVDTSKSMLTPDVRPNRLERTKLAVRDLVKKLKGDRIGLIAFAGSAFRVCPLTVDYNGFLISLDDLDVNTIPRGGTNISAALEDALKQHDRTPGKYKAVIILTDGENLEGDPLAVARKAKEAGVKVYCVGIGTKEGELIRVTGPSGRSEYLKDSDGNVVKSSLNEDLLQKIALATGGAYVRASGAQFGLELIYDQELSKLEKREIESKMEKRYEERFQIPLGLALLAFLVETCVPRRRRGGE